MDPFGVENLTQHRVQVGSREVLEVLLADALHELHYLETVAVGLDPVSKFGVFALHLFQQLNEQFVDFVFDVVEIWAADVGIVGD